MLTSLHIQEFKGLRDINIPELRKVNLILGGQNVGKTSLLEAIVFVAGDIESNSSPGSRHLLPEMFRPSEGGDSMRFWKAIVGTEQNPNAVKVLSMLDGANYEVAGFIRGKITSVPIAIPVNTGGSIRLITGSSAGAVSFCPSPASSPIPFSILRKTASEQVTLYGKLVTQKKKKSVLSLLRKIDYRIDGIDAVAPDGEHRIYVEMSDSNELLPISQLGHGFTRLFELYAGLAVTDSKLALIDEIENGIHYSALPTLFQGVRELSESNDVQSIITTHSLECIKSAYEVFEDKLKDFQMIRLERSDDGSTRAVVIADENLKTVMEAGWEIR